MTRRRNLAPIALFALLFAAGGDARGADWKWGASAAGRALKEGKALLGEKRYAEACPKIEESNRLQPNPDTLLLLAQCHEAEGKLATAQAEYEDLVADADPKRPDRTKAAKDRMARLETKIARLTINVPAELAAIEELEVKRDGVIISKSAFGVPLKVDAGDHAIAVSCPGKKGWSTKITVRAGGERASVQVPELESDAPPPVPTEATPEEAAEAPAPLAPKSSEGEKRATGYALGAIGLVAAGAGAYFGLSALDFQKQADARCPGAACTDPQAVRLSDRAMSQARLANLAASIGAVSFVAGIYLIATAKGEPSAKAPTSATAPLRVAPSAGPRAVGVQLEGAF